MSEENLPTHLPPEPTQPYPQWPQTYTPPVQPAVTAPQYSQPMPTQGYQYSRTTLHRPQVGGVHIAIAWVFAVFTLGYFLPWAVAASRQKSNTLAIGLLNFFVGWTLIGWIAALVMACMSETVPVQVYSVAYAVAPAITAGPPALPAAGWYPDGSGGRRYWDGSQWTQHTAP